MTYVLGIDPGGNGAFAVYCNVTRRIVGEVIDMPVWFQTVGKRKRKRIDALAIADLFDTFSLMGVEFVVMEAVGGRTGQGAAAGFVFGYGVGLIYMATMYSGIAMDTVPPATWKQVLNVPGKAKADDSAILNRANELFPDDRHQFLGERGGRKVDRAEAAMIAKFGGDIMLNTISTLGDVERKVAYMNADTGA